MQLVGKSTPARSIGPRTGWLGAVAILVTLAGCSDSPTMSEVGEPNRALGPEAIEIWWPHDGVTLSGVHPFKALLRGYELGNYRMYWAVDAGQPVHMYDSYEDWPHKEAWVGFDGWSWNGNGPYKIHFIATRPDGQELARRTVTIYVGTATGAAEPVPTAVTGGNPLAGATFWVDAYSQAYKQAEQWYTSRPADAETMKRIASRSQADWFGDWNPDVRSAVDARAGTISATGALPVFVAYNIPIRDCNLYSAGGAASADAYRSWIRAFAEGIGNRKAVVILEPDALAAIDCLPAHEQQTRKELIADAVHVLKAKPGIAVYVDAGNGGWQTPEVMAKRLTDAGIAAADGYSLNVSNFHATDTNIVYGEKLSALIGGKHFVIDTSRNGLGGETNYEWCNSSGRALGHPATTNTGHELVDAFLWIKRPGESDGTCNGGPPAGHWWADYALGLAERMPTKLAMLP